MGDLSVRQVFERLHISEAKIRTMVSEGRFPHAYKMDSTKIKSPFLIPEAGAIAFENAQHSFQSSRVVRKSYSIVYLNKNRMPMKGILFDSFFIETYSSVLS